MNDVMGKKSTIKYGVHWECVLGHILFKLYINLVRKLNFDGLIASYAKGTCLLFIDKFWEGRRGSL